MKWTEGVVLELETDIISIVGLGARAYGKSGLDILSSGRLNPVRRAPSALYGRFRRVKRLTDPLIPTSGK